MKKKIFLWNPAQVNAQYSDLGDIAMFHVMLDGLKNCDIVETTNDEEYTHKKYGIKTIPFGFAGLWRTWKGIKSSDLIVVGGGDLIQDKSSLLILPFNLSRTILALLAGKPVMASGIGVDDYNEISFFGRMLTKIVLNRYKLITLRDAISRNVLNELGVTKPKIMVTADSALGLRQADEKRVDSIFQEEDLHEGKYVGVFIRSTFHRTNSLLPFAVKKKLGLLSKEYKENIEDFCNNMAEALDYLIEKYDTNILFMYAFPKCHISTFDDEMTQNIFNIMKNKTRVKILETAYDPEEIKGILAKMEFLISIPLHPIIIGSSAGIPVLDINYAAKVRRFMKLIGQEDCIVEIKDLAQKDKSGLIKEKIDYIAQNKNKIQNDIELKIDDLKKQGLKNPALAMELAVNGDIEELNT